MDCLHETSHIHVSIKFRHVKHVSLVCSGESLGPHGLGHLSLHSNTDKESQALSNPLN